MILESLYSDGFAAYLEDGGAVGLTLGFVDGLANMGGLVGRNSSAGGREDVGLTVPPIEGFDVSVAQFLYFSITPSTTLHRKDAIG